MTESEEIRDTLKSAARLIREDLDRVLDAAEVHDLGPQYGESRRAAEGCPGVRLDRINKLSGTLALIQTAQNGYLTLGLLWDLKEQVEKNTAQLEARYERARH